MNKKFTNKKYPEIIYEVRYEGWLLGKNTYVIVFNDMKDDENDVFHLEVEYHKDKNKVTFIRVYEFCKVSSEALVTYCFKEEIKKYILRKCHVVKENSNMKKEVILVEVICKNNMLTDKSKVFTNTKKAEAYFTQLVKEAFPNIEQDDIDNALDDGFYDFIISYPNGKKDERSVTIKDITLEEG